VLQDTPRGGRIVEFYTTTRADHWKEKRKGKRLATKTLRGAIKSGGLKREVGAGGTSYPESVHDGSKPKRKCGAFLPGAPVVTTKEKKPGQGLEVA